MNKYKTVLKYILLFIYFFLFLVINYNFYQGDTIANFGFSYALVRGEIPYLDFNMVIPPLSPFIYSIPLYLYNNIVTLYITQTILLCIFITIIKKLINNKYLLFILLLSLYFPIPLAAVLFPGYNFISILLLFILLYELKYKNNPYLIGITLGLLFTTKQTLGLVLFIPSIYYLFKDRKIFLKRLLAYLIPILILLIYLLINNNLQEFINLCLLGLLNFGTTNSSFSIFYLLIFLLGIIYLVYRIFKNKKDYELYYIFLFGVISLPIIDYYHVSLFLVGVIYIILRDISIPSNINKYILSLIVLVFISSLIVEYNYFDKKIKLYNYNHFSLYLKTPSYNKKVTSLNSDLKHYNNVYYLLRGTEAYFFRMINDEDITYYDLLNRGNYGLGGDKQISSSINNLPKDSILVVDDSLCHDNNNQFICDSLKVLDKSKLIKEYDNFKIYVKVK